MKRQATAARPGGALNKPQKTKLQKSECLWPILNDYHQAQIYPFKPTVRHELLVVVVVGITDNYALGRYLTVISFQDNPTVWNNSSNACFSGPPDTVIVTSSKNEQTGSNPVPERKLSQPCHTSSAHISEQVLPQTRAPPNFRRGP